MLICSECGRQLEEKEALVHKAADGSKKIICPACCEKLTGVDYRTFAYRKENARQTFFAVLFCLAATGYAFYTRGWEWGVGGIVLTLLVYFFSSKAH